MTNIEQMRADAETRMGNPTTSCWHPEVSALSGYVLELLAENEKLEKASSEASALLTRYKAATAIVQNVAYVNGLNQKIVELVAALRPFAEAVDFRNTVDGLPVTDFTLLHRYEAVWCGSSGLKAGTCRRAAELLKLV